MTIHEALTWFWLAWAVFQMATLISGGIREWMRSSEPEARGWWFHARQ